MGSPRRADEAFEGAHCLPRPRLAGKGGWGARQPRAGLRSLLPAQAGMGRGERRWGRGRVGTAHTAALFCNLLAAAGQSRQEGGCLGSLASTAQGPATESGADLMEVPEEF